MKLRWRMLPMAFAAIILLGGIALFVVQLTLQGRDWAAQPWNDAVYEDGVLSVGTVEDRNGEMLTAAIYGEDRLWNDDWTTRVATLHAVGDPEGNIGTGALSVFQEQLTGYDLINGLYSANGTGGRVTLSIDAELSRCAYDALDGRDGCVMVCNYKTGEILCMVSTPAYDPADGEAEIPEGSYLNRAMSAIYPPGSIFKIVTAAAALEQIPDIREREFLCEGSVEIGGDDVTCTGYHGWVTIEDAFAVSCNCAFAEMALELGSDVLQQYASAFGLTSGQVVDGIETAGGSFDAFSDGSNDLAWSGIGQATDLVNPASFLRLVCAVANLGQAPELTLLANPATADMQRYMPTVTAAKLSEMMEYAVEYTYGEWNFPGLEMHAKSGTAEIDGEEPHAWFTGFVTNEDAPYAFVVILEHGGSGADNAGYVASTVMQQAVLGTAWEW